MSDFHWVGRGHGISSANVCRLLGSGRELGALLDLRSSWEKQLETGVFESHISTNACWSVPVQIMNLCVCSSHFWWSTGINATLVKYDSHFKQLFNMWRPLSSAIVGGIPIRPTHSGVFRCSICSVLTIFTQYPRCSTAAGLLVKNIIVSLWVVSLNYSCVTNDFQLKGKRCLHTLTGFVLSRACQVGGGCKSEGR